MKILICGDVHWSTYSSILRERGKKYSKRLENLIQSVNWVENTARQIGADQIVYLGDFFDKPILNAEEISALTNIDWCNTSHNFLVGNHEMSGGIRSFFSCGLFNINSKNFNVVSFETGTRLDNRTSPPILYLPYVPESERKPLVEYFPEGVKNPIVFSHNDIKGIQMGKFLSTSGFSVEEIEQNCELFINGHLHNSSEEGYKIINVGNLTGQNFGEDGFRYFHRIMLLDTENRSLTSIFNPFALNFYKLDLNNVTSEKEIDEIFSKLVNAVITVKVPMVYHKYLLQKVAESTNIVESRIIIDMLNTSNEKMYNDKKIDLSIDYLNQFQEYIIKSVGNDNDIIKELQEVLAQ